MSHTMIYPLPLLLLSLTLLLAVVPAADAEIVKYRTVLAGDDCMLPEVADFIELDGLRNAYRIPYDKDHGDKSVPPFKTVLCKYLGRDAASEMQWDCEAIGVEQDAVIQFHDMLCDRCITVDPTALYTTRSGITPNTCRVTLSVIRG